MLAVLTAPAAEEYCAFLNAVFFRRRARLDGSSLCHTFQLGQLYCPGEYYQHVAEFVKDFDPSYHLPPKGRIAGPRKPTSDWNGYIPHLLLLFFAS